MPLPSISPNNKFKFTDRVCAVCWKRGGQGESEQGQCCRTSSGIDELWELYFTLDLTTEQEGRRGGH